MCEYCENDKNIHLEDSNKILTPNKFFVELFDDYYKSYSYDEIQIKFCPMCGRRLSNEKQKELCTNKQLGIITQKPKVKSH